MTKVTSANLLGTLTLIRYQKLLHQLRGRVGVGGIVDTIIGVGGVIIGGLTGGGDLTVIGIIRNMEVG